jgi:hypothetical protein
VFWFVSPGKKTPICCKSLTNQKTREKNTNLLQVTDKPKNQGKKHTCSRLVFFSLVFWFVSDLQQIGVFFLVFWCQ